LLEEIRSPVGRPDFKSGKGRQSVLGGFDSHSFPPEISACEIVPSVIPAKAGIQWRAMRASQNKSSLPFDKLMELLAIRLSPQAGKSLVIRANGLQRPLVEINELRL